MLDALFHAATMFSPEQYLWWTRLQCIAWTAADGCIVYALIRLANAARGMEQTTAHVFPYLVLGLTLSMAPLVVFAPTGRLVFALEVLITVPHFALILYVLAINRGAFMRLVTRLRLLEADRRTGA